MVLQSNALIGAPAGRLPYPRQRFDKERRRQLISNFRFWQIELKKSTLWSIETAMRPYLLTLGLG